MMGSIRSDVRVYLRLPEHLKIFFLKYCSDNNITLTNFILSAMLTQLQEDKKQNKAVDTTLIEELQRNKKLLSARRKSKQNSFYLYWGKNYRKRALNQGFHDLLITKKVNMRAIRTIVADAVEIFDNYPASIKEVLNDDLLELKKYSDEKYFEVQLKKFADSVVVRKVGYGK